jgi:hypothetical protein
VDLPHGARITNSACLPVLGWLIRVGICLPAIAPFDDRLPLSFMELLITLGVRLLETMFVVGGIGSFLVLILTGIEDIETLFGSDDPNRQRW